MVIILSAEASLERRLCYSVREVCRSAGIIWDFDCEEMEVTEYWRSNADGVTQTTRGSVGNILQWFAGIAAAFTKLSNIFRNSPPPASDIAAESRGESAAEAAGAVATATQIATATPTATSAVAADAKISQDGQVTGLASNLTNRKSSVVANWSECCSMISGAGVTTSRRRSRIDWTRPRFISTTA